MSSMTDNEIVKALEHCWIKDEGCGSKEDCPYYGLEKCIQNSVEDGIDLIQRQQERIERLKDNLDAVLSERADHTEAIEDFVDKVVEQLERLPNVNSDYWNFADLIDRDDALEIVKGVQNE